MFVPARLLRPTYMNGISGPAIVLPFSRYDQPFFAWGDGPSAMACFIGREHTFESMPAVDNPHWHGFAIENLEIEADITTAYSLSDTSAVPGSLVRSKDALMVTCLHDDGMRFRRTSLFAIETGLPEGPERQDVAFRSWRVVKREEDREVFSYQINAAGFVDQDSED